MSAIENVKKVYDKEAARRGCDPQAGLEIGAWRNILREALANYQGTDADIAESFLQADTNKDDMLTFDEFKTCMTKPHLDETKMAQVEALFKAWDKSGDSKLSKDEVQQIAGKYRPETIERILQKADKDGDGFITCAEFKAELFGQ